MAGGVRISRTTKICLAGGGDFSSCCNIYLKCQVRCTGVLPYHTCPHHLRWRWLSSPRSGRVSPWFCCRAGRSGPASGSGRPGSSCGSRCKTWNQESSAGTPAQRGETGGNGERDRRWRNIERGRDRQWEIVTAQVLIVMCAVAFMGPVSKNCAWGAKNSDANLEILAVAF